MPAGRRHELAEAVGREPRKPGGARDPGWGGKPALGAREKRREGEPAGDAAQSQDTEGAPCARGRAEPRGREAG